GEDLALHLGGGHLRGGLAATGARGREQHEQDGQTSLVRRGDRHLNQTFDSDTWGANHLRGGVSGAKRTPPREKKDASAVCYLWQAATSREQRQPLEHQDEEHSAAEPPARPRGDERHPDPCQGLHPLPAVWQGHQSRLILSRRSPPRRSRPEPPGGAPPPARWRARAPRP